jgi:integrase
VTDIQLNDYHGEFQDHVEDKLEDGVLKPSTADQRRYAIDELVEYFEYHDKALYTDDFYQSVDNLKQFFHGTVVHGSKVACIRAFLEYIEKQLPEREAERLRDVRERIKPSRVDGVNRQGKVRTKQIEEKILTDRELEAVFSVADEEETLVLKMMLDMGTRPGELAALTPSDINWDYSSGDIGATVKIDKTYSQGNGVIDSPKTEDSIRTVNLRNDTVELLKEFIDKKDVDDDELMFNSYRYVYNMIKDVFSFAWVKIGSDMITDYSPHNLRHQTITRLIVEEDYPKEKVQRYVGHSSVEITEIYEHFKEDQVVDIYA